MDIELDPMVRWSGVEGRPLVIAGPCSAESESQLRETARRLESTRVDYFRAGVWKARTRPDSFEGIGDGALLWLQRVKSEYGFRVATEVARAQHVEAALRHDVDLVWIGARTTTNPFSVQEIAVALRGTEVPVLVKNPLNPNLGLWIGAVERVHRAGVRALGVIHRGFSTAASTRYRNPPMWELVVEMRRRCPGLPMLTDPSHICGRRDLIRAVAQRALDLGVAGLMVETHPDPDQALSDAEQQITPERLTEILSLVAVRTSDPDQPEAEEQLEGYREQIDVLDEELLDVLARRMEVVDLIAECKSEANLTPFQMDRWRALLEDRMRRAGERGLDPDHVKSLYQAIHDEALRRQNRVMNDGVGAGDRGETTQ